MRLARVLPALCTLFGLAVAPPVLAAKKAPKAVVPESPFQLVESWPVETTLDHADIPAATPATTPPRK